MPRTSSIFLLLFTYCLLIGFTYALIGQRVYSVRFKQFPFVVSISRRHAETYHSHLFHLCTGTIIRPKSILTTAHCLKHQKLDTVQIVAGSVNINEGQKYYPESWVTFDQWNHNKHWEYHMNDIAVIILQGEGITNSTPAEIPFVFHNNLNDHKRLTIAGWGESDKGNKIAHLKAAQLFAVTNKECSDKGTELKGKKFTVPENYFCTTADPWVVSSNGDGGAPIFTQNYQLLGIHIGVCPNLEGYSYSTEFLYQNQLNSHLHISYYKEFIEHVWK